MRITTFLFILSLPFLAPFSSSAAEEGEVSLSGLAVKKQNQSVFGGFIGHPSSNLSGEVSYTLGGADAALFAVGQHQGKWFLRAKQNFAKDAVYSISVVADNGTERATGHFHITVGNGASIEKTSRGERICLPFKDGVVPVIGQTACGSFPIDDWELVHNVYGMSGHPSDKFEQCLYRDDDGTFGWQWNKGETSYECPGGNCPAVPCYYQMSFAALEYGINPWGMSTSENAKSLELPIKLNDVESLTVHHDLEFIAHDDLPGKHSYDNPSSAKHNAMTDDPVYARHALIYDLFLTDAKPQQGKMLAKPDDNRLTDEVIINVNYNPGYPDTETCNGSRPRGIGDVMSESIKKKAVFSGGHWYDYHSWSAFDTPSYNIVCNYHQFRRVGGDAEGASVPENLDLMPFFNYVKKKKADPTAMPDEKNRKHLEGDGLWFGRVIIGMNIYDHTHGSVRFRELPTLTKVPKADSKDSAAVITQSRQEQRNSQP